MKAPISRANDSPAGTQARPIARKVSSSRWWISAVTSALSVIANPPWPRSKEAEHTRGFPPPAWVQMIGEEKLQLCGRIHPLSISDIPPSSGKGLWLIWSLELSTDSIDDRVEVLHHPALR